MGIKEGMRLTANTKIVTANITIKIVIESSLLSVFKHNTHETGPPNEYGGHFFNDNSYTPLFIIEVGYPVAKTKI